MSRHKAKESFNWKMVKPYLEERGVKLISAGLDEVPMVYKDIEEVMAAQTDLVEPLAKFFPRLAWSKWRRPANGRRTRPPQSQRIGPDVSRLSSK